MGTRKNQRIDCLLSEIPGVRAELFDGAGNLVHQLQTIAQWDDLKSLSERVVALMSSGAERSDETVANPFYLLSLPTMTTAEQQLIGARQWVERELKLTASPARERSMPGILENKTKFKIGYLSGDFRAHAVAYLIAELIEKHDRGRFEIFGYSSGPDDHSPTRQRLMNAFDRFVDVREMSDADAVRMIEGDEIDILVDLSGHTKDARTKILGLRPAPIQVNYLGYPGTIGASFMDYILVDDFVVPPEEQPYYAEKLVFLPGCYQVNDSRREIAEHTPSRADCGLPETAFVFCCFNNNYKITPDLFDVWMRLLQVVPKSVLWLFESHPLATANLRREAEIRGVSSERLIFAKPRPLADHLARHRLADLFLDTIPYNAHTTASDALWAGCPLLTMSGETFASRVAGSLLRAIGLPELITSSLADYERRALDLARDKDLLDTLRGRLQSHRSTTTLFDSGLFARNIEKAFQTMWEIHASGSGPFSFRVND